MGNLRQTTARTVEQALEWIESNPHHYAGAEDTHILLRGHMSKLKIPNTIKDGVFSMVKSGGQFDNRMYRANDAGLALLGRPVKPPEPPLTASALADALGCFWNGALGHQHEGGTPAACMAVGLQLVADRLKEIANGR